MNKQSGQGLAEYALILVIAVLIICVLLVGAVSLLDKNNNGILDSRETIKNELYQE